MRGFFDPSTLAPYNNHHIVLDNNVLSSMYANEKYLEFILRTFESNILFLDPIVKLEFLRGAYSKADFNKKTEFLEFDRFALMADHQVIFQHVYKNAFDVARIYAHNGNPKIPLGDILIIARLMLYEHTLFLTLDKGDFSTVLFDRCNVLNIEKPDSKGTMVLEHLILLQFNKEKYQQCLDKLPSKN